MLIAKYKAQLNAPLHTAWAHALYIANQDFDGRLLTEQDVFSRDNRPEIEAFIDQFRYKLELSIDQVANPLAPQHGWVATQSIDITALNSDFDERSLDASSIDATVSAYAGSVRLLIERLVTYCQFELGYPFLRSASATNISLVGWYDQNVSQITVPARNTGILAHFPGAPGSLGSKYLTRTRLQEMGEAISKVQHYSVQDELLSQARDAIYEVHTLKAVLLLAITCEVAIKSKFFREESLSAIAFDYLEEKRQVEVTVIELIDHVAKRAFGQAFKEQDADAAKDIEHLFRCRNKVAHRARAEFKDDKGTLHQVGGTDLHKWWKSVTSLMRWLSATELKTN